MQRVVVAVEAVQQRGLGGGLVRDGGVGGLALGRGEALGRGALGAAPVALGDVEGRRGDARVDVARGDVDEVRLRVDDGAGPALVVDADDLGAGLELAAGAGGGEGLEELDLALAVDDAAGVEGGNAGDLDGLLGGVEVDDFLGVALEGWRGPSQCRGT